MKAVDEARRLLTAAVAARVFPAAVTDVGASGGTVWREAFGAVTFAPDAAPTRDATPFDLASLTKPIATTTVVMDLVAAGRARLDDPLASSFAEWRGPSRERATLTDLLEHASGLPARLLDPPPRSRREFEHEICSTPLEYEPRTRSVYSDLGFILLGMLAERLRAGSLAEQFDAIRRRLGAAEPDLAAEPLTFALAPSARRMAAPTSPLPDDVRRGRNLVGEVHDSYAAALDGVAGHAGLFGTAAAVAAFARVILRALRGDAHPDPLSLAGVSRIATKSAVPGSSRALGWDTMLPGSSCGTRMSAAAIGHVGFTGTSLWIDPVRDRYFVLLTNRACDGGTLDQMRTVRRAFHDALADL